MESLALLFFKFTMIWTFFNVCETFEGASFGCQMLHAAILMGLLGYLRVTKIVLV